MFWFAVRADGIGSDGVTDVCGLDEPLAAAPPEPPAAPVPVPVELDGLVSGVAEGVTVPAGGAAEVARPEA
jgi:hypothetical protein